jgi:GntR family transcriptional regulator
MKQVRRLILTGVLREGERMETVRQAAERVNVNPMTVSKAYAFLEAEGLLDRRRGVGLFVAGTKNERCKEVRSELAEEAVDRAVFTAMQMGMSQADIEALVRKSVRKHVKGGE